MKNINFTVNGINIGKKFNTWAIKKRREGNPRVAAKMIDDFLKDKGLGYAIAAIPDVGKTVHLKSCTGIFVDKSCIDEMVKEFLIEQPDFKGQIYADDALTCIVSKMFNGCDRLVYETSIA